MQSKPDSIHPIWQVSSPRVLGSVPRGGAKLFGEAFEHVCARPIAVGVTWMTGPMIGAAIFRASSQISGEEAARINTLQEHKYAAMAMSLRAARLLGRRQIAVC